jgi:hypothetical protein
MAQSPVEWADRIAAVSDRFKNATITIIDPSLITSTYDPVTDTYTPTGDGIVAEDIAARIQPVRLAVDMQGGATMNPTGEVRVRIQIPRTAYAGRVEHGWRIRVISADRNPELLEYLFTVDANVNSSWRASNTIEASVNVENEVA